MFWKHFRSPLFGAENFQSPPPLKSPNPPPPLVIYERSLTVSAQFNCIKQVTKRENPTGQRQIKRLYRFIGLFMVNKCSSYSKMTEFEIYDFSAASKMMTGCYDASILLFVNARTAGTPLADKCHLRDST